MVYRKKHWVLAILITLFATVVHQLHAQEGFGTAQPNRAAVIDLTSESKGLLVPRISLSSLTSFLPIKGLATGQEHTAHSLFVYNVASVPLAGITPGYYYWSKPGATDAGRWIRMTDRDNEAPTTFSQNLTTGVLSYVNEASDVQTATIHWKLNANGTGLTTNNNVAGGAFATALGGGEVGGNSLPNFATGDFSVVAGGVGNHALGFGSMVLGGTDNRAAAVDYAAVLSGTNNRADGGTSTVVGGSYVTVSGTLSLGAGERIEVPSNLEVGFGRFSTTYVPAGGATGWNPSDRLFNIGNGSSLSAGADAFTILKNGRVGVGFNNFEGTAFNQRLQVNGGVRIATLPDGATTDKLVVADADGVLKALKAALPKFFYMPSIVIPTADGQIPASYPAGSVTFAAGNGRIELHALYSAQFTGAAGSSARNPGAATGLPVLPAAELNYHITWYDNTVFTNVVVSDAGVLTYQVAAGADIDEASFMNIIFEID